MSNNIKIIRDEISSLTNRISATFTRFWLLLRDSDDKGKNPDNFIEI